MLGRFLVLLLVASLVGCTPAASPSSAPGPAFEQALPSGPPATPHLAAEPTPPEESRNTSAGPGVDDAESDRAEATIDEVVIQTAPANRPPAGEAVGLAALAETLGEILREHDGTFGVVVEHVPSGQRLVHNHRRVFRAASVYKAAVAHQVLRLVDEGTWSLEDRFTIEEVDATEPEPDEGLTVGDELTVREGLRAMMSVSSNAAAYAFLRQLQRSRFDASLSELGLRDTRVASADNEWTRTTPEDMATFYELIVRDRTLSDASRVELLRLLALCEEPDGLVEALPNGITVLSKAGNLDDASNVAGLVLTPAGPIIFSILDEEVDPGEARATIGEIARAVLAFYVSPVEP